MPEEMKTEAGVEVEGGENAMEVMASVHCNRPIVLGVELVGSVMQRHPCSSPERRS